MRALTLAALLCCLPLQATARLEREYTFRQEVVATPYMFEVLMRYGDVLLCADAGPPNDADIYSFLSVEDLLEHWRHLPAGALSDGYARPIPQEGWSCPPGGPRVFSTLFPADDPFWERGVALHSMETPLLAGRSDGQHFAFVYYDQTYRCLYGSAEWSNDIELEFLHGEITQPDTLCEWDDSDLPFGHLDGMLGTLAYHDDMHYREMENVRTNGIVKIMFVDDRILLYNHPRDRLCVIDGDQLEVYGLTDLIDDWVKREHPVSGSALTHNLWRGHVIREGCIAEGEGWIYIGIADADVKVAGIEIWRFTPPDDEGIDEVEYLGYVWDLFNPCLMEVFDGSVLLMPFAPLGTYILTPLPVED